MGTKLLWTGLTAYLALPSFLTTLGVQHNTNGVQLVGAVIMVIGAVVLWLNK